MLVKPRLYGIRFWIGSCPPSKPRRTPRPERAFWPFVPRPAVLPLPLPWPRPTRLRSRFVPGFGRRSSSVSGMSWFLSLAVALGDVPHEAGVGRRRRRLAAPGGNLLDLDQV